MKCYFAFLFLSTLICCCYAQYSGLGSSGGKSKSDEYDIIFDLVSDFMNRFQSKESVWATLVMMGSPFKPVKLSTRIIYGR